MAHINLQKSLEKYKAQNQTKTHGISRLVEWPW